MSEHTDRFRAAVRGIPTNHLTQALNVLTPGTNWTGCSKSLIAREYESAIVHKERQHLRALNLDRLARMARARAAGDQHWRSTR